MEFRGSNPGRRGRGRARSLNLIGSDGGVWQGVCSRSGDIGAMVFYAHRSVEGGARSTHRKLPTPALLPFEMGSFAKNSGRGRKVSAPGGRWRWFGAVLGCGGRVGVGCGEGLVWFVEVRGGQGASR